MSGMIPGLDGLRAIAFLLVFAFHTDYLESGWVGVSLFFVLSGFLITGILLDMKKSLSSRDYFFKFYGRRFLRIFPLYYFYLIVMALLATWMISIPFRPKYMQLFLDQIWYAVLYVYDFFFATSSVQYSYFLDHFWSLSVEEQFYIFWPLLILLVPEKWLKKLFIGFIVLAPLFRLLFLFIHTSGVFRFLVADPATAVYPLPFSHMDAFAVGAYISRFHIPKAKQQFFLLAGLIPVLGFASTYMATGNIGIISALGYPLLLPDAYKFIWGYSLLNYFFAVIVYGVAVEGWFTHFLEWRMLRYLGKISYGLYVYHFPIVWFSGRIADLDIAPPLMKPLTALIAFAATLLVASLSYHFMERPIINLKDRFFPLKSSTQPENVSAMAAE
jgi:peptidoglycan/LPS O-acetylase OafA/YrhL